MAALSEPSSVLYSFYPILNYWDYSSGGAQIKVQQPLSLQSKGCCTFFRMQADD